MSQERRTRRRWYVIKAIGKEGGTDGKEGGPAVGLRLDVCLMKVVAIYNSPLAVSTTMAERLICKRRIPDRFCADQVTYI